jgi:hypothetical protein
MGIKPRTIIAGSYPDSYMKSLPVQRIIQRINGRASYGGLFFVLLTGAARP